MLQHITPIACRPWLLNGLSERLIVSHYENNYGGAVRSANAIRRDLEALDPRLPRRSGAISLEDEHISGAGAVGLWTKADGETVFDDFSFGTLAQ